MPIKLLLSVLLVSSGYGGWIPKGVVGVSFDHDKSRTVDQFRWDVDCTFQRPVEPGIQ